ncbi:hypothetical protein PDJAM_G00155240 [Pangasius djambal]|uniref:Uncharacterized protein n=1 Tax=Pangasius djambal TaxID=1691987 RepID=A0ACC5ZIG2_9TELE|nr:hypothetical protein [Pangasius djambal]
MGKFGVKERNLEGQMVVDFAKRMDMAVVNTYFQKREEHRVTYKSGGRSKQVDYILCRRGSLKEISDCKVVVGESVARQHRMVVCRMTLMVCKRKKSKIEIEKKTKWWKLKKEECCEEFRQKLRQALGGQVVLPDDWETTAEVIRVTGRKVLGVSSGRRKEDKETWWWNKGVQDSIQRKGLAKKKWDMDRTKEIIQEYKERRVKREVSKAKQEALTSCTLDFNGHVGEGNTGDEEVMGKFGVKERNLEGQMVVDFAKRMDMAVVNTYFQKREEHRVTYKSGGRSKQVDYILCRRGSLKEISDCKVVVGESVARQHRMVVCRMTLMVCKRKKSKIEIEKKTKWWKLKKEECCEEFRQKSRQALGGQVVLPDDWETTAEVIRVTGRKVLGVSSGRRKEDKETWWWNEGVQDSIQRKGLAKKKWDMDRTKEIIQEYKERRVKREVSKAKQEALTSCTLGQTEEFKVEVGLHQGSALSPFLFAMVMDQLSEEVRQESPYTMMFADDIVICSESREQVEENLVRWRFALERRGMKVSRSKTVYMCVNEREGSGTVRLQGEEVKKVQEFKYLGSTVQSNGECGKEVKKRVQAGWNGWRKVSGVLCDRKISARIKGKVYKTVVRAAMLYGLETVSLRKRQESELEVAELKMLRFSLGVTRVPREELWYCMRKSGVAEKYVRVVQDMYERSRTVVRCAVGQTEEFKVEVGLHQGSALSPFLLAMVMDQLSEEVRQESPCTMMFADDIVICSESREQVEENLERWRFALERRGMKVSRSKTEYMYVNEREGSGTVRLQGEEVKKVQEFKYLGSTVQSNGECGKEVKKRVQAGWNGWRKVSGVLCDRKISARIKGKVYKTVVRPAMLYGLETVTLRKRQEAELEVAELKMLRFSLGVTWLDRIRNEYIRGTAHVGRLGDKVREARLRWFGHVQRRESEYIGRRMLDMELPGRRRRGRPKRRVPREELWYCMRKSGVAEKYVRVVQDMYERSRTVVRCAVGQTEEFKVEVGLHQGSALSPFPFAMVMDQLSEEVRQ